MTEEEEIEKLLEDFNASVEVKWPEKDGKPIDDRVLAWCVFERHSVFAHPELKAVFVGSYDAAWETALDLWLEGADVFIEGRND